MSTIDTKFEILYEILPVSQDYTPKKKYEYYKRGAKRREELFDTTSFSPTKVISIIDSIDKYFITGGFVDIKGNARGKNSEYLEKAKELKNDYFRFINSKEGRKLENMLDDKTPYDGFIYTQMDKNVLGANITTPDGKNYLVVNSLYYDNLSREEKMMLYTHETIHKSEINKQGYSTEKTTEEKSAKFFKELYQNFNNSEYGKVYNRLYAITSSRADSYTSCGYN